MTGIGISRLATACWIGSSLLVSSVAIANPEFQTCLNQLRPTALNAKVSAATFDQYTRNLVPDMSVLDKLNYQPEFQTPIWDYMSGLVDQERVELGQQMLKQHADVLRRIEAAYGVDAATVVAVWGVETNFGNITGKSDIIQSLATLSCFGRRQAFFRGELNSALRILQGGHVDPTHFKGSWAGAFGQTQFMPSTFERIAVDFTGDGKRDIVDSIPDALASTANYLKRSKWQTGQTWGFEVKLPAGFSANGESRRKKRAISEWSQRGLTRVDGTPLAQGNLSSIAQAGLLSPAGVNGPTFLVFRNFDALYSYNAAESYALAIAHLSDRMRGGKPFVTAWPTDDPGISRAQRRELQQLLINRGHEIGEVDGMIGEKSRAAIRIEQALLGLTVNGRGGQKILDALTKEAQSSP
ncbi:MAG: lytic murein transglycosylase [Pseudomonadota bacterium]|nr:lytic murein transglycosylase [Pseudomonadota bacterium]